MTESTRNLHGENPARVRIAYEVEIGDSTERRELPFVIGVLGDFSACAHRPRFRERRFTPVGCDTFNTVLDTVHPRVQFKIASSLAGGELDVDLTFHHLDDFGPERIPERIEPLRELLRSTSDDDQEICRQHLDKILHAPEFQRLESAWRGLWYLVSRAEASSQVKIKLIDVSKEELLHDLRSAPEVYASSVSRKLYDEPYGIFGGEPFGLLIGDYTFTTSPEDIELLSKMAAVASVCLAPFLAAAGPDLVGVESFAGVSDFEDVFGRANFAPFSNSLWESFRQAEDSRYVGLSAPRILLRHPYGSAPVTREYQYNENSTGEQHLLWGNSAFALGACIANSFARSGWFGSILGADRGLAEGLPVRALAWAFRPGYEIETSIEVVIGERAERGLERLGFIPLLTNRGTGQTVVASMPSCHKPKLYLDAANIAGALSCQLPHILAASRFMHYVKAIERDFIGAFRTPSQWEQLFNSWISQYVLVEDNPSPAIQALQPLRAARIEVTDRPGRPVVYRVLAFLRPHFQLARISHKRLDEPRAVGEEAGRF
jgi:type VI secretion system protein ImpC